jgi:hypothetical protein
MHELLLLGRTLDAAEMVEWGLAGQLVGSLEDVAAVGKEVLQTGLLSIDVTPDTCSLLMFLVEPLFTSDVGGRERRRVPAREPHPRARKGDGAGEVHCISISLYVVRLKPVAANQ